MKFKAILAALRIRTSSRPRNPPSTLPTTKQVRNAGKIPYLPPEIWIHVFSTILTWDRRMASDHLRTLCLVSRQFGAIGQPFLFETTGVVFAVELSLDSNRKACERMVALTQLFNNRPEIAAQVKDFDIMTTLPPTSLPPIKILETLFLAMPYLETVSFNGIKLNDAIYCQLYQLPRLRCCQLEMPQALCRGLDIEHTDLQPADLRIEELVLKITGLEADLVQTWAPALVNLAWAPHLKILRINSIHISVDIYKFVLTQPVHAFNAITLLEINIPQPNFLQSFFTIFASCTSLRDIRLSDYHLYGVPLEFRYDGTIPAAAAPNLHTFHGPFALGRIILPSRPVSTLSLVFPSREPGTLSREALQPLTMGTAAVQKLHLRGATWSDGCLQEVASCFPYLVHLMITDITGPYMPWLSEHGVEEILRFPVLQTITLQSRNGFQAPEAEDISIASTLLETVSRVHRELLIARFHNQTWWQRDYLGHWSMSTEVFPV